MKKVIKNLAMGIIIGTAVTSSYSVFGQATSVETNDLHFGFENSAGDGSADYIINLGPASAMVGGNSVVTLSGDFLLSDFNSSALVGTNSASIVGGVVGGSLSVGHPSDFYVTELRSGGVGIPSVPGSIAPTSTTKDEDNLAYTSFEEINAPASGAGLLDGSKTWESYVEPTYTSGSVYGNIGINPDSSVATNTVLYEDLWYTVNNSLSSTQPFTYEGYFTLNLTGSSPKLTFTPEAAPAPLTSPQIVSISKSGNTVKLVWSTVPTHSYQLQYTVSLYPTNWTGIGTPQTANYTLMTNSDTGATSGQRFYRVTGQ